MAIEQCCIGCPCVREAPASLEDHRIPIRTLANAVISLCSRPTPPTDCQLHEFVNRLHQGGLDVPRLDAYLQGVLDSTSDQKLREVVMRAQKVLARYFAEHHPAPSIVDLFAAVPIADDNGDAHDRINGGTQFYDAERDGKENENEQTRC